MEPVSVRRLTSERLLFMPTSASGPWRGGAAVHVGRQWLLSARGSHGGVCARDGLADMSVSPLKLQKL